MDIANARLLFSSPALGEMISVTDKELARKVKDNKIPYWTAGDHDRYSAEILKRVLMPQLERIVKPDGFFVYT